MQYLVDRDLIVPQSRSDLVANTLVLVAPAGAAEPLDPITGAALLASLGDGRLAVGDPDHVPAGIYARQALESLDAWPAVEPRLARAESVRAALAFVARKEAPLGIVYGSDAHAEPGVRSVATFPDDSHSPIRFPVALVTGASPEAQAVLDFLRSPEAGARFIAHGFLAPSPTMPKP